MALTSLFAIYDLYGVQLPTLTSQGDNHPVQYGRASWYGREEQGKLTANGEHFDRNKLTAASRKLPFNTEIRVTNQENGRSVEVRINDRGPYVKNRVLDVSEAAAKALDMKTSGVTPVKIEVLKQAPPLPATDSTLP